MTCSSASPSETQYFSIDFITFSPAGFRMQTRTSKPRHIPCSPLPEARRIRAARDQEPKVYRIGDHFAPKVGLRNVTCTEDTLQFDIVPVTFPAYAAIHDASELGLALTVANPAAVAAVLFTAEHNGGHRLI